MSTSASSKVCRIYLNFIKNPLGNMVVTDVDILTVKISFSLWREKILILFQRLDETTVTSIEISPEVIQTAPFACFRQNFNPNSSTKTLYLCFIYLTLFQKNSHFTLITQILHQSLSTRQLLFTYASSTFWWYFYNQSHLFSQITQKLPSFIC